MGPSDGIVEGEVIEEQEGIEEIGFMRRDEKTKQTPRLR